MTQNRGKNDIYQKKIFIEFMKNDLETLDESDTNSNGQSVMRKNATFNSF